MLRLESLALLPDFPSLRGNRFFADFWFRHIGASLSARACRDETSMNDAMETATFAWSQLDADPSRGEGVGSSACAGIAIRVIKQCVDGAEAFWKGVHWASDDQWRLLIAAEVRAWDRHCLENPEDTMGNTPGLLAEKAFGAEISSNAVEVTHCVVLSKTCFLEHMAMNCRGTCGITITALKKEDVAEHRHTPATGNTITIVSDGVVTIGVDPHARNGAGGMTLVRLPFAAQDAAAVLATWLYDTVLPDSGCSVAQLDLVFITRRASLVAVNVCKEDEKDVRGAKRLRAQERELEVLSKPVGGGFEEYVVAACDGFEIAGRLRGLNVRSLPQLASKKPRRLTDDDKAPFKEKKWSAARDAQRSTITDGGPRRPVGGGYQEFMAHWRAKPGYAVEVRGLNARGIQRLGSSRWRALTDNEKAVFVEEHDKAMVAWKATKQIRASGLCLTMLEMYRQLATALTSEHADLHVVQTGFLLARTHAVGYGRVTNPKVAEVRLRLLCSRKANSLPGAVCWAFEAGGGYRDKSGNSYWRIHAAMKLLESKKLNRNELDDYCKWHECSEEELQEIYEGHEDEPMYLWKWREVRVCSGRSNYIRAPLGSVVWANFKFEDVVDEGVFAGVDFGSSV